MIPYRFLSPAEEEMTEAGLFYELSLEGLGSDFLVRSNERLTDCLIILTLANQ